MLVTSSFFSYFYLFFLSPRHLSRKRSLTLRGSVCARLRFVCFFSFSRKWSVRFFESIQGSRFAMLTTALLTLTLFFLWTFFTDPFVYFNMNMFFTNWRNDSAIYSRATVFFLSFVHRVTIFFATWCLFVCFFSSSKVSINKNKNANRGQFAKRKSVRDSRNCRKGRRTTCVLDGIQIGSSRQRIIQMYCILCQQHTKKKKKEWSKLFL